MNNILSSKSPLVMAAFFSLFASHQAHALVANPDRLDTTTGVPKTVEVLWNDTGGHFWVSAVNQYSKNGGRAYVVEGRKIHYTPKSGFNGTDEVWYVLRDQQGRTNSTKVSISVH